VTPGVSGPPLAVPVSVRVLLLGDATDLSDLRRRLEGQGVLALAARMAQGSATATGSRVEDEVTGLVAGLLDLDLGAMVLAGWKAHHRLAEAQARTKAAPGTTERVPLAHHVITATHAPRLDVRLAGRTIGHLDFTLLVELDILGVEAEVTNGRIVGLPCGDGEVTATLSTAGKVLLASQPRRFSPGLVVRTGRRALPAPRSG
jgi:hypothetical protein